jgi:hypothetical protein
MRRKSQLLHHNRGSSNAAQLKISVYLRGEAAAAISG